MTASAPQHTDTPLYTTAPLPLLTEAFISFSDKNHANTIKTANLNFFPTRTKPFTQIQRLSVLQQ